MRDVLGSSGYSLLRHPVGSICSNFAQSYNKFFLNKKIFAKIFFI